MFYTNAQISQVCLVKYKDLKSPTILGTHNHWFYQNKFILTREPNLKMVYMKGFPVLINNVMTTQTDTIKYNKEFIEFVNDRKEDANKRPKTVWMKQYNSDIQQMTYYNDSKNKNYVVLDSLDKMNTWEILDDTLTVLGYKCQKATINYKQESYTAWFTSQLPYNAGPDFYRGLPGLILKVSNPMGNKGYEAVEIQIPYKGAVPEFNSLAETISRKEYLLLVSERNKKTRESMDNMINDLKKQGAIIKQ